MSFVSDSFTDTNGTLLQSHTGEVGATWTLHPVSGTVNAQIANNRLRTSASTSIALYYASGVPATAEYDVQGVVYVASLSSDSFNGVCGRLSLAANTMYLARYNKTAGQWQLLKFVAGAATTLGTFTQSLSVGGSYVVKLQLRDAAKKVFIDGVERISSSDNAITGAGRVGVRFSDTSAGNTTGFHIDSLVASDAFTTAAASLSAQGSLTTTAGRIRGASTSLTGEAALTATAGAIRSGAVSLSATSTLAAAAAVATSRWNYSGTSVASYGPVSGHSYGGTATVSYGGTADWSYALHGVTYPDPDLYPSGGLYPDADDPAFTYR